jgi:septum site-determining protein MinD
VFGAILNRSGMENTELRRHSVEDVLGVRVIDMIPEDTNVRRAAAYKTPVVLKYPTSEAARAFRRIAADLAGYEYAEESEKVREGFIERLARTLFGGAAR